MISQIDISGFRSIKEAKIPLKKLNILYGQNGSGKSSVMYAPYVFRNFFKKPNQPLNNLFNFGWIDLGGFNSIISHPEEDNLLEIGITVSNEWARSGDISGMPVSFSLNLSPEYGASLNITEGQKNNSENNFQRIGFSLPYQRSVLETIQLYGHTVKWDGLSFYETVGDSENSTAVWNLNELPAIIKEIALIPIYRGFFQHTFSVESNDYEDKVAYSIRQSIVDLEPSLDVYVRKIFGKIFRFVASPRGQLFSLKTQNKWGMTTDLVNEGFGVNQAVYMLIHKHPNIIK